MPKILVVSEDQSFFDGLCSEISKVADGVALLFAPSIHRALEIFELNRDVDLTFLGDVPFYAGEVNHTRFCTKDLLEFFRRPCNQDLSCLVVTCSGVESPQKMIELGCDTITTRDDVRGFILDFVGV